MFLPILLAFTAVVLPPLTPQGAQPHGLEVKELADILALSQVIIDKCPNMLVNASELEAIRNNLHFNKTEDGQSLIDEARGAMSSFEEELAHAPSATVWCNANYELYGPTGNSIRGLLLRRTKQ